MRDQELDVNYVPHSLNENLFSYTIEYENGVGYGSGGKYEYRVEENEDYVNNISIGDAGDSISNATLVALDSNGDATITGNTNGSDSDDWYKFTTSSSGSVAIDLTELSSDLDLYLYDSDGNILDSAYLGQTINEHITQTLNSNSTYYVRVNQYEDDSSYNLTINAPSDRTLISENEDYVNNISIGDAGDSISNATLVALDSNGDATITGNTNGSDSDDWYKFTTSSSGSVAIDLTELSSDLDLYLYDSDGNILDSAYLGQTINEHITQTLNSNSTYYVRVNQYEDDSSYNLTINAPSNTGGEYSHINNSYERVNYDINEVQALDYGKMWDKDIVTYSFNEIIPNSYRDNMNYTRNFQPLTNEEREVARDTFNNLENYIDLSFRETTNNGDIRFSNIDMDEDTAGFTTMVDESTFVEGIDGDIFLNSDFIIDSSSYVYTLEKNGQGKQIISHEIGHALGLKHPFSGNIELLENEENTLYSIMSYTHKNYNLLEFAESNSDSYIDYKYETIGMFHDFYSLYDIEALQAKYGVNENYNTGNSNYGFDFESGYNTLWDGGGEDTLDLSLTTHTDIIDLNGGSLNSVDMYSLDELVVYYQKETDIPQMNNYIKDTVNDLYDENLLYTGENNLGIVRGTIIENLFTGSGDDIVWDNNVDNIINTGNGNDIIYIGKGGFDQINGGEGIDRVYLDNSFDNVDITTDSNSYCLTDDENNYMAILEDIEYIIDAVGVELSLI